jgi:hypothetical protein
MQRQQRRTKRLHMRVSHRLLGCIRLSSGSHLFLALLRHGSSLRSGSGRNAQGVWSVPEPLHNNQQEAELVPHMFGLLHRILASAIATCNALRNCSHCTEPNERTPSHLKQPGARMISVTLHLRRFLLVSLSRQHGDSPTARYSGADSQPRGGATLQRVSSLT